MGGAQQFVVSLQLWHAMSLCQPSRQSEPLPSFQGQVCHGGVERDSKDLDAVWQAQHPWGRLARALAIVARHDPRPAVADTAAAVLLDVAEAHAGSWNQTAWTQVWAQGFAYALELPDPRSGSGAHHAGPVSPHRPLSSCPCRPVWRLAAAWSVQFASPTCNMHLPACF